MPVSKIITSVVLSASIATSSLVPLSTAANAGDWNRYGGYQSYGQSARGEHCDPRERAEHNRYNGWGNVRHDERYEPRWHPQPRWHDADADYSPRHRDHDGRNAAIGAFAAILGLAIAAQASHANTYDGDNY